MKSLTCKSLLLLLALTIKPLFASEPIIMKEGTALPGFSLKDQHGKLLTTDHSLRFLLFTHDKAGSKVVKKAFAEEKTDLLVANKAMAIAEISGMPSFITKTIALPRMRKYPYRLGLDREGHATVAIPREEKMVTVIELENGLIKSIQFVGAPIALKSLVVNSGE